jgi:PAS domain S-box-containing protein
MPSDRDAPAGRPVPTTEDKRLLELRQFAEMRLRQMVEQLDDPVWVADPETLRVLYVNAAYERIFGRSRESLYERTESWIEAIHPDDRPRFEDGLRDWYRTARYDDELRIVPPEGEERRIRARAFPIRDETGAIVLLGGIGEDVTEQRAAEAERERLEEAVRRTQKLEAVGRLAGGVAHDFNNVLAVIAGAASMLQDEVEGPELRRDVDEILAATERAAKLVSQLLSISRPRISREASVDLVEMVKGAELLLSSTLGTGIEVELELDPATPPARLEQSHAEQLLLNLSVNARDAMPAGGTLTIRVCSSTLADEPCAVLEVADTGPGVPPAIRERIFEPFFTTRTDGTGLGLSTVHRTVTSAGGSVEFADAPAGGAIFRLLIPRANGAAAPDEASPPPGGDVAAGRTILLVEDEQPLRRVLKRALEAAGYAVVAPERAEDASDLIRAGETRFDLMVTDIVMPGLSGEQLAEELQTAQPGLPVVFMSGYAPERTVGSAPAAERVLAKPFRPQALLAEVALALDGRA